MRPGRTWRAARLFLGPALKPNDNGEPAENDPRRVFRRGKSNANGTANLDIVWDRGRVPPRA